MVAYHHLPIMRLTCIITYPHFRVIVDSSCLPFRHQLSLSWTSRVTVTCKDLFIVNPIFQRNPDYVGNQIQPSITPKIYLTMMFVPPETARE